jgi:hypothetical protein
MGCQTYTPEILVGGVLRDPVRVHVLKKVVSAERFEEGANAGAVVRWYYRAVGQPGCGVRRRYWVILTAEIAILSVRAIAREVCQLGLYL